VAFAKSASLSASIWSALALAAAQASAQETTSAEIASDAIPSALEEIVVSATKREESLQRVPVSVNAISGDQLKQSGVVRLQDMQLPSLTVQEGGIGNSVFIRGIGSGINPGFEQSCRHVCRRDLSRSRAAVACAAVRRRAGRTAAWTADHPVRQEQRRGRDQCQERQADVDAQWLRHGHL
jgi:hypothetical protein